MHGHVRKRHAKNCATRRNKTARCNCDGSWQARYPDPNGRNNTAKIERTFGTSAMQRPGSSRRLPRSSTGRTSIRARRSARSTASSTSGARPGAGGRTRRPALATKASCASTSNRVRRGEDRRCHPRRRPALHQPPLGRSDDRAGDGAERLRRLANGLRLRRANGDDATQSLHEYRPPPAPAAGDGLPESRRSAAARRRDRRALPRPRLRRRLLRPSRG
jgi:hypothetical protein